MPFPPLYTTGGNFGPMRAGGPQTLLQFAAGFQQATMSTILAVAQDKLISDNPPQLYVPPLPNLFP